MIWTIPNILTFIRILAAPGMALVFAIFDRPLADWLALALFVGAAVTDFFDGWLSRRLGQESAIGKMLDPIADKAMVIVGIVIIAGNAYPMALANYTMSLLLIPTSLIVTREVLVSGLREYLGDVKLHVTPLAKWKTTVQLIAVASGLLVCAFEYPVNQIVFRSISVSGPEVLAFTVHEAFFIKMYNYTTPVMMALMWLAAILTVVTGWDYFKKGLAHIQKSEDQ